MKNMINSGKAYRLIVTSVTVIIAVQIIMLFILPGAERNDMVTAIIFSMFFTMGYYITGIRGKIILSFLLGFSILTPIILYGNEAAIEFLKSFFYWVSVSGEWIVEYVRWYEIIIMIFISFLCCIFALLLNRYRLAQWSIGGGLLLYLLFNLLKENEVQQSIVSFILFYLILCYVEYIQGRKSEEKADERDKIDGIDKVDEANEERKENVGKRSVVWLLPFLLLYLLVLLLLPANQERYEWKYVRKLYEQIKTIATAFTHKWGSMFNGQEEFRVHFSGFSDSAEVGGDIRVNSTDVMIISANYGLNTNLYLIGGIFDTFNGKEWERTDIRPQEDYYADFVELMYAIDRNNESGKKSSRTDYVRTANITIRYQDINTYHMFIPLKTFSLGIDKKKYSYRSEGGELLFAEVQGYHTEYLSNYMQMNIDHPDFYEMMIAESEYRYGQGEEEEQKILNNLNDMYRKESYIKVTEELLKQRAAEIQIIYGDTKEPDELIQKYLENITGGYENDIDKLKAIENELKQYEYTTNPGVIPRDREFMEYFLLESREGYCTYFATAFVLLARYEGIPARYVQGFCVPVESGSLSHIQVTSDMAHAWPEAYIEGVGWIPFEPTPAYDELRYTPWKTQKQLEEQNAKVHYELNEEMAKKEEIITKEAEIPTEAGSSNKKKSGLIWGIAGLFLLCVILTILTTHLFLKYRYRNLGNKEKLLDIIKINFILLSDLGYKMNMGQTLAEFYLNICDSEELSGLKLAFLTEFEEIRYGNKVIDNDIIKTAENEKKELFRILKGKYWWKYIIRLRMIY